MATEIKLGPNEFLGRLVVYGKEYTEGSTGEGPITVYQPGAFLGCSERLTLAFFQHQLAVGVCRYFEDDHGLVVHGRIALVQAGGMLLKLLAKGHFHDLCPTVELFYNETRDADGRQFIRVSRAEIISTNFVLTPAYAGAQLLRMGPVSFKPAAFDAAFIAGHPWTIPEMFRESKEIANKWSGESQILKTNGVDHESWIRKLEAF